MTVSAVKAAKRRVTSEPNYSATPMPATVYRPIAQQALKLTGAEITLVAVAINHDIPTSEVADLMIVETAGAAMTSAPAHAIPLAGTSIGQAFVERTPRRLNHFDVAIDGVQHAGPALVLPLRTTDTVAGVLVALRRDGARTFDDEQLDMMAAFTDQAALAWQLGSTQRRMRELDIIADRDRIARDLHHHVIQRIFAVELALQGTIPRVRSTEVQQRLSGSIDDLQGVIQEIRTAIFDLHGAPPRITGLRQRLDDVVAQVLRIRTTYHCSIRGPLVGCRCCTRRSRRSRCARSGQQRCPACWRDHTCGDGQGRGRRVHRGYRQRSRRPRRHHRQWLDRLASPRAAGRRRVQHRGCSRRRHRAALVSTAALITTHRLHGGCNRLGPSSRGQGPRMAGNSGPASRAIAANWVLFSGGSGTNSPRAVVGISVTSG